MNFDFQDQAQYQYQMPTKLFFGPVSQHQAEFGGYGNKALIVTGRSSAKNGALNDILDILRLARVEAVVFDRVEENPSVENVFEAAQTGLSFGADFVIGIGGGSPLDSAKAAALLLNHPKLDTQALYDPKAFPNGAKPALAVPTTAGTGSEATPFSILTRHSHQAKGAIPHLVFYEKAFLNPAYTYFMPEQVTLHTAVDALAHLTEGYLSSRANPLTDAMAEGGLGTFGRLRSNLTNRSFDAHTRMQLLNLSTLAGIVITQTKTSLPHQLGYALTYHKNVPHGAACGILLAEYLRIHPAKEKTSRVITLLGLSDGKEMKDWLKDLIRVKVTVSEEEIEAYVQVLFQNPERLKVHPAALSPEILKTMYRNSLT